MATWQPYHDWPRDEYDSHEETVRALRLDEAAVEIANQRALDARADRRVLELRDRLAVSHGREQANRIVLGMAHGAGG